MVKQGDMLDELAREKLKAQFLILVEEHAEAVATLLKPHLSVPQAGAVRSGGEAGRVDKAPRAEERTPGQWWVEVGHAYTFGYDDRDNPQIKVWKKHGDDYLEYPVAWVKPLDPGYPKGWVDQMEQDGRRHEFKGPVYLVMKVSDRQNAKGNYFVNCQKMTTKREEAGL